MESLTTSFPALKDVEQDPFASVWSGQDRQLARSLLRRVMAASIAAGTPTYLDSGTLLGFVREGKILDWDDDIDLVMVGERQVPVLIEKLAQQGLRVLDPTDPQLIGLLKIYDPAYPPTRWQNHTYTWPFIDVFVYDWRGPKLTCKSPFKHSSFYENPYSPGRQEVFEDVLCWVPERPLVLLDRYYTDWRVREVSTTWNHRMEQAAARIAKRPIRTDERGRKVCGEVLMILAGARASGKSWLLRSSLKKRLPLFGVENDPLFQKFSDLEEYLVFNPESWVRLRHYRKIEQMLPKVLLLHLDLMTLCSFDGRPYKELGSVELNYRRMCEHPGLKFFDSYSKIIVNTLYTPWHISSRRFQKRIKEGRQVVESCNGNRLYLFGPEEQAVYDSVYAAWERCIARFPIELMIRSVYDDGEQLKLTRIG